MKKIQLPLALVIALLIVPLVAIGAWWNPFHWFKKREIQTPATSILIPTTNDRLVLKKNTTNQTFLNTVKNVKNIQLDNSVFSDPAFSALNDSSVELVSDNTIGHPDGGFPPADYSQSIKAIDIFLANPTLENLKTFCTSAKTLSGYGQTKVLNDTRTDFVMKNNTLYDDTGEATGACIRALGEYKNFPSYHWVTYSPLYLLTFDNPNESDEIRSLKISYNTYWKSLSQYKLIGFINLYSYYQGTPDIEVTTPNQVINELINTGSQADLREARKFSQLFFLLPERILIGIRAQLVASNK